MKPKAVMGVALGLTVLVAVGVGAYTVLKPKPFVGQAPPTTNTDPNKPPVTVGIATGYNPVKYDAQEVDLTHLNQVDGYRYAGGLV